MASTMETWAKVMGAKAVLKGGIEGANKQFSKFGVQGRVDKITAKQEKAEAKKALKEKKEANRAFLREHNSLLQAMYDRTHGIKETTKKEEEAADKYVEEVDEAVAAVDKAADGGPKRKKTGGRQKGTLNKPKEDISPSVAGAQLSAGPESTGGGPTDGVPSKVREELGVAESTAIFSQDKKVKKAIDSQTNFIGDAFRAISTFKQNQYLGELLDHSREGLKLDAERAQREIKSNRRALEDRRDAKRGGLGKGKGGGGPSLIKKEGKGWMTKITDSLLGLGTKYLLPIATSTAGLIGLKKFLQGANNADDIANAAGKIDELAKGVSKITPHIDETIKAGVKATNMVNYADDFASIGNKFDDVAKTTQLMNKAHLADDFAGLARQIDNVPTGLAKTTQIVNYADNFAAIPGQVQTATSNLARSNQILTHVDDFGRIPGQVTGAIDGATDLARAGTYVDDFGKIPGQIKTGTLAVQSTLEGGVKATNVGKLSTAIDGLSDASRGISTTISGTAGKVDNVAVAVQGVSGKLTNMDDFARLTAGKADEAARAAALARNIAQGVPTTTPAGVGAIDDVVDAGVSTTRAITSGADATGDAARLAAQNAEELAKTLKLGAKTGTGLLGRFAKILTPLDIFNKMGQGQTLVESIANMGVELSSMVVGGTDWAAEGVQKLTGLGSGEGFIKEGAWGDSSRALEVGDAFGNKEKWQTSYLEQGINSVVAGVTGTEKQANAKTWTAEQEQMAKAADDTGAVTVGFGRGSIDDLEKVTLLDPKAIQALLDFEVWSDKDMKMLEDLKRAKQQGISVEYDDGGWLGREKVNFGPGMDGSPTNNVGGARAAELERLSGEMRGARSDEAYRALENEFMKVKAMTPAEFDALTPNAELQDTMNAAAVNPGSIFTHDMHVEKAFQDLFSGTKTLGSAEAIPSEYLQQAVVSAVMMAEKSGTSGGPKNMINAPQTTIDNSTKQVINPGSTAHAPSTPAGSGHMGISTPRG